MGSSSHIPFQDPHLNPSPTLIPKLEPITESTQNLAFQLPNSNPQAPISSSNEPSNSDSDNVAETFRSAFAQRLQRHDDVTVLDSLTGAIVPVEDNPNPESVPVDASPPSGVFTRRPKPQQRSSELVRITDVGPDGERQFRENVRRTRMVYDSLRIYMMMEEAKRLGFGGTRKGRPDSKAASLMKDCFLWLNRDKRIVGSIPGVQVGDIFFFRLELCVMGLHGQTQAGIDYLTGSLSSNGEPIATSVIVSGGYEDDDDQGDVIIYTGHGGQDKLGKQAEHQKLEGGNLAMDRSMYYGIEVRVIRGLKYENSVSSRVYVYDGLFRIVDSWFDVGISGFGVYKFRLERIDGQAEMGSSILKLASTLKNNPLSVRPTGYISFDISNRKENVPVYLFNDIDSDQEPLFYEYLAKASFPPGLFIQGSGSASGCSCITGCTSGCICEAKNSGEFAYDYHGKLIRLKPLIHECGPACQCPPTCRNRVTQNGLKNRLEVFRSLETGWGVRSLDVLHAGAFICEYAGVALTREQANIMTMNGDTLVYPARFSSARWEEWGDLSQVLAGYQQPSYPQIPPVDFAMDVSKMRNVACYISHSTDPNVIVQLVLHDHNSLMFPRVMLFAAENIPPMTELSLDYGVADDWTAKLAISN
ncbi:PREDICTED: histone-lysine N-methyltransferase family member SUVH9 isoform X3 [Camelina sativa]|uniref:Histone-lysine N-methyltransferase family member SUVH9 isoform X1 n=1 Tax=Camelina sativa TaxID=90675 RepID=A0ABM1QGX7_CAMSA|nr:PREDICTED: histone-lysine N-methyltransferase family member SUVH9 isoform X1 [Camelina sativa]XP_010435258.1 PREDICTED: histone-lysine N-methyltransferase family member SUVH9 isoform X1 [Camelina sativa]XP_010435259.1 PREDICTED: histone-lysine N-methyltransferase family member SUVH9 isoform X2 [Camelina sativa]XP_019086015.1 PREDICTED: histone-lysine N-methyltransferase family member SUVH9 isoform X3 [Camelina sativa]